MFQTGWRPQRRSYSSVGTPSCIAGTHVLTPQHSRLCYCCLLCGVAACREKSITKFAKGLLDGSVEPEYKSAPIPDEPTDGGVTVVVGKNFDSIVKDKEKDVLLEVSNAGMRARGCQGMWRRVAVAPAAAGQLG